MKAAPSRQAPAVTEAGYNNDPTQSREECAKAFALAVETAQEPWTCLALWFANRRFLNQKKANVRSGSTVAETNTSA